MEILEEVLWETLQIKKMFEIFMETFQETLLE